jgi:hypothetical protein
VVLCAAAESAWASFPGANGTIAYSWIGATAYRGGPTETSIRTVDPRSGVVRVLQDCPLRSDAPTTYTDCGVAAPSYAPGGGKLAFTFNRITPSFTGQPWQLDRTLAIMASDGSFLEEHRIEHDYFGVSWSPAGDQLLLERLLEGPAYTHPTAIFLASLDGTELSQVGPDWSSGADWSSRREIAASRLRDSNCVRNCLDIYVTPPGGTGRLTYRGGFDPSWSPGGTKLAFARTRRGRTNVFIVRRDGRGLRRLTGKGGHAPAWSPDGKWIALIRNGDLHVVRTDGRSRRRLVDGMVNPDIGEGPQVTSLDWQAVPRR